MWDGTTKYGRDGYALRQSKARNIHRFRIGAPANRMKTSWESYSYDYKHSSIVDALVKDTFVWLLPEPRTLNVCNLRTTGGKVELQLRGDAHELIIIVALSDELIAFATSLNTCYVTKLDGSNRIKFRLAPGMFQQLACRSRTVVCGGFVNDSAVIYLWDFDTQSGTSFEISTQDLPFASRIST